MAPFDNRVRVIEFSAFAFAFKHLQLASAPGPAAILGCGSLAPALYDTMSSGFLLSLPALGIMLARMHGKRNVQREYAAAQTKVAVLDGAERVRVRVSGADATSFLQNMLSHDVKRLQPGQGTHAAFLTNKGKLVAEMRVFKRADDFLIDVDASRAGPLSQAISRYIISEDVLLDDWSDEEASFDLVGPRAAELAGLVTGEAPERFAQLPHLGFLELHIDDRPLRVSCVGQIPLARFQLAMSATDASDLRERTLHEAKALEGLAAGSEVAEMLRIAAGEPRFGVDIDESHLPQEAGLERALSFEKGCYIGQEVVVRLAHRGHVNRKLVRLEIEGAGHPSPGDVIRLADTDVGNVTSSAALPEPAGSVALGLVRREAFEPGTTVTISTAGGELGARVRSLATQHAGQ